MVYKGVNLRAPKFVIIEKRGNAYVYKLFVMDISNYNGHIRRDMRGGAVDISRTRREKAIYPLCCTMGLYVLLPCACVFHAALVLAGYYVYAGMAHAKFEAVHLD